MERRFVIREWNLADPNPGWTVTESELIHRLDHAFRTGFCTLTEEMDWDKVIEILLTGDAHEMSRLQKK